MSNKKKFLSILVVFLLSSSLSIVAMLSKPHYTQEGLFNKKRQTDLLFYEFDKNTPDINNILFFIEHGADINARDEFGETPLNHACAKNNLAIVEILIENGAAINMHGTLDGNTPLHIASEEGNVKIADFLVTKGADVNSNNYNNDTPLHKACKYGHFNNVVFLIEKKANVNAKNKSLVTPLHRACDHNFFIIVEYLIKNGADVNATTITGYTPLHIAVIHKNIKMCELLLQSKANPNLATKDGITALDIAYDQGNKHIILLFKKYGISTISEKQADENMYALFAELNEEKLQKKEKFTAQQQKKKIKKIKPKKQEIVSQQEIEKRKQQMETSAKSGPNVTTSNDTEESLIHEPIDIIVTSPIITASTTSTTSTTSTIPTSSYSGSTSHITPPSMHSKYTIKKEKPNNEYLLLIDKNLKWPPSLNHNQQESIKNNLRRLKNWPNNDLDVKKLKDKSGMYRLRVGGYRIIFSVNEAKREIKIHAIGLRKNVYKNLKL